MYNFKHIKSLDSKVQQLTLQQVINQRACINHVYQAFSFKLNVDQLRQIVMLIGGHSETRRAIMQTLTSGKPQHWGLDRILYSAKRDRFEYCAGQDYPVEMKEIRKALKS